MPSFANNSLIYGQVALHEIASYKYYGNTGCGVFKRGIHYQKDFWINGELSKAPKFDFQSQFSMPKIIRIFLNFFLIEGYQL